LGIGDGGLGIGPNPQSPIPNPHPQSPLLKYFKIIDKKIILELNINKLISYKL
jgi:hypothetical protein